MNAENFSGTIANGALEKQTDICVRCKNYNQFKEIVKMIDTGEIFKILIYYKNEFSDVKYETQIRRSNPHKGENLEGENSKGLKIHRIEIPPFRFGPPKSLDEWRLRK